MPTKAEIAWAAGLFEGEGCMRPIPVTSVELTINMTDLDVLQRFQEIVGVGAIYLVQRHDPARVHWKQVYAWKIVAHNEVQRIIEMFLPWFMERRSVRALEMLDRLSQNKGLNGDKTHCKRGHPLSGENLYLTPGGKRQCRTCRKYHKRKDRVAKVWDGVS